MSNAEQIRVFRGRYEVLGLIGQGGMARVLRVMDNHLGVVRALKYPMEIQGEDGAADVRFSLEEIQNRFRNECIVGAQVNHPGLVTVTDRDGEGSGVESVPFFVMEYVDGTDMGSMISDFGAIPPRAAVELTIGILEPVAALHTASYLHRDLKPSNIFVRRDGKVKVGDLGLAKTMLEDVPDGLRSVHTQMHLVLGTREYMSPERRLLGGQVDERSDLYAVAVILWQLLTGIAVVPIMRMETTDTVTHKRLATVSEVLRPIIVGALQPILAQCAYRNAPEMIRALKDALITLPADGSEDFYAWLAAGCQKKQEAAELPPSPEPVVEPVVSALVVLPSPPREEWPETVAVPRRPAWRSALPTLAVAAVVIFILGFAGMVLFRGPSTDTIASATPPAPSRSEQILTDTVSPTRSSSPSFSDTVSVFNSAFAADNTTVPVVVDPPADPAPAAASKPIVSNGGSRDTGSVKRPASTKRPAASVTTTPVVSASTASVAPIKGTVKLIGRPVAARLVSEAGGGTYAIPADVPPGTYRVQAKFSDTTPFVDFHTVEVAPGGTTRVRCDADATLCN